MENKSVFNCFLNCIMLLLSRMFLGSLIVRMYLYIDVFVNFFTFTSFTKHTTDTFTFTFLQLHKMKYTPCNFTLRTLHTDHVTGRPRQGVPNAALTAAIQDVAKHLLCHPLSPRWRPSDAVWWRRKSQSERTWPRKVTLIFQL